MSDPISAVAASSTLPNLNAAASATQAGSFNAPLSFSDLAGAPSPIETRMTVDFQNIVKDFQSKISNYATQKTGSATAVAGSDAVATHKLDFFPQSAHPGRASDIAITGAPSSSAAVASEALNASFDHALFVTLVSQVVSGVGQTVSTLIKQQ